MEEASEFIRLLYPDPKITFQTFSKTDRSQNGKILHGTIKEYWWDLQDLNSKGSGIYGMVNAGSGLGRNNSSVVSITNLLLDLDGSPVEPVLECPLKPHIILNTSEGRYQARWRIESIPITLETRNENKLLFKKIQLGLAARFNGDPSVNDLARCSRIPQFYNHNHESPYLVKIFAINDSPVVSIGELAEILNLNLLDPYARNFGQKKALKDIESTEPLYEGTRNNSLFDICRRYAYQEFLGKDLYDKACEINSSRCDPPLETDEIISIINSVTGYWFSHMMSVDDCIAQILEKNPNLMTYKDHFYNYNPGTCTFRFLPINTLHDSIFVMTKRTAGRSFIEKVLCELKNRIGPGIPITPEGNFIQEFISKGGKVKFDDVRNKYLQWCQNKGYSPLKSGLGKEIELRMGVERKRIKVEGKNYYGFLGISLRE